MIGIDLVKISRIQDAVDRGHFIDRAFTPSEINYYREKGCKTETLAGMYAAKEAVVKALGCGFGEVRPIDIEIFYDFKGKPTARLSPKASKLFGIELIEVSITHEGDFAFAAAGPMCDEIIRLSAKPIEFAAASEDEPEPWLRNSLSHKGDFGRIYVIGGSAEMPGAPLMCARAALKAGAGLVTLCAPMSMASQYGARSLQNTLCLLPDINGNFIFDEASMKKLDRADVVVLGMGMGSNPEIVRFIEYLARRPITLIIDADGLNTLAKSVRSVDDHKCRLILTPHQGEFVRFGYGGEDSCRSMAKRFNAVVVKKSAVTEISDGELLKRTAFGTPALAKGGSGDILAGIIAALCVVMPPVDACLKACYTLGSAAKKAEEISGENSVTAEMLLSNISV